MSASNRKRLSALLIACSFVALVGCDADEIRYPADYKEDVFNISGLDGADQIAEGQKKNYYGSLTSDNSVYEKAVNQVLTTISKRGFEDDGTDVTTLCKDLNYKSVADDYANIPTYSDNITERAKESLTSSAKNGSYEKDNLFMESKYVKYLNDTYYYFDVDPDDNTKINTEGKLLTPFATFSDAYKSYDTYSTYVTKEMEDETRINYLTAEYIYEKTYASIGNSNARKVMAVSITDRSDEPGAAKKFLDAYIKDYIKGDKKDPDFSIVSRLWKGITSSYVTELNTKYNIDTTRYDATEGSTNRIVCNAEEEAWLVANGLINTTANTNSTLVGKIQEDEKELAKGTDNYYKVDSSLESSYTGSYTYDIGTGVKKAVDDIATKSLVTKGLYLKSSGISALPSTITDRIFSTKITSDKDKIAKMNTPANYGKKTEDYTVYENDGYRYLTVADSLTTDSNDNILYYDSSSKTYYITRILDVVDTSAVAKDSTTSIYDTDAKKEQIAREVAYAMSTTGSYKTDSADYWLSRTDMTYFDENFLDYIKSNYKDVFKTDNPYADESKFVLKD